jgi:hypothetical protein
MPDHVSTLQDFPFASGIQAVKDSLLFSDFDRFYAHVVRSLPQNSPVTRERYASLVVRWFFPDHALDGLMPHVWKAYHNDQILLELARVTTLEAEPVIAQFVTEVVLPLSPGQVLQATVARDYIVATYGVYKHNSHSRLANTLRHLGFLSRNGGKWIIAAIPRPANALLILLHARLSVTPRIVRIADLLATEWWTYLGFRTPDEVRAVLRDAQDAGLIARYSIVEQLEQVTTRYSLDTYLDRALTL